MRKIVAATVVLAVLFVVACGGGDDDDQASPTATPGISGVVVTTELTLGPNRFAVGLIDGGTGALVLAADVSLSFLKVISAGQAQVRYQVDATAVVMDRFYIDPATGEQTGSGQTSVFVAEAEFGEVGEWGVQITGAIDGASFAPINLPFEVSDPESVLNVGDPAPRSRQATISDVADVSEIDTMTPPDSMHDIAIEDAVTSGSPSVILFGTPAFCETLTCGPVLQSVVLPLHETYGDRAHFIHVEPFFIEEARNGRGFCAVPAYNINLARAGVGEGPGPCPFLTEEELEAAGESWNLTIEPVVFVVDSEGNIAGKFEAVVSREEIEALLQTMIP